MQSDEPAGRVDMAAAALRAAKEDARFHRGRAQRSRMAMSARRRRRDAVPVPFSQVLSDLLEERIPVPSLASVRALWSDYVPEIAKHVCVTDYDAAHGVLSVRADSTAWGTQTRLLAPRLIGTLNEICVQACVGPVQTMRITGPRMTSVSVAGAETGARRAEAFRPVPRPVHRLPQAFTRYAPVTDPALADAVSRQATHAQRESRSRLARQQAHTEPTPGEPEASVWRAALRRARAEKASAPPPPTGP
ncbi:DciA family protein [Streptomyces sp. NPDC051597]|uniref:DciA family protein n=1 Tax=Streptomyces sp. NPDC051597 TaxID=3155049 RepID=UPI00341BD15C